MEEWRVRMFDKNNRQNKIIAKNSNVIIGDNASISNVNSKEKSSLTKGLALVTALVTLVKAIFNFLSK